MGRVRLVQTEFKDLKVNFAEHKSQREDIIPESEDDVTIAEEDEDALWAEVRS